jgi:hypothetical protein
MKRRAWLVRGTNNTVRVTVEGRCRTAGRWVVEDATSCHTSILARTLDTPGFQTRFYHLGFEGGIRQNDRQAYLIRPTTRPGVKFEIRKAARLNTSFQTCKVPRVVLRLRGKGTK